MFSLSRIFTVSSLPVSTPVTLPALDMLNDILCRLLKLSDFSSMYGPPDGLFLLAWHNEELAGGVGFRKFDAKVCEMKRLFVYEQFLDIRLGRSLCIELIKKAKKLGYEKMRLDTLGHMKAAIRLYTTLGFKEIAPYRFNPDPTAKYMELNLR